MSALALLSLAARGYPTWAEELPACQLPVPSRQGDLDFESLRNLITTRGYRRFVEVMKDASFKNHLDYWTALYRAVNGTSGTLHFGKSAQLLVRVFSEDHSLEDEEVIEFMSFDPKERTYLQGEIVFPEKGSPKPVVYRTSRNELRTETCRHCHGSEGTGGAFRRAVLNEFRLGDFTGFIGEKLGWDPATRSNFEWIDRRNADELAHYRRLLSLASGTGEGVSDENRERYKLRTWRASDLPSQSDLSAGSKGIRTAISAIPAPNTYLLDRLQELNAIRLVSMVTRLDSFKEARFAFFGWATDACRTPDDWQGFGFPGFSKDALLGRVGSASAAPKEERDSIGTFVYLLEQFRALDSTRASIGFGEKDSNFSNSLGGIELFKKAWRAQFERCETDLRPGMTCRELQLAYRRALAPGNRDNR